MSGTFPILSEFLEVKTGRAELIDHGVVGSKKKPLKLQFFSTVHKYRYTTQSYIDTSTATHQQRRRSSNVQVNREEYAGSPLYGIRATPTSTLLY